VLQKKREKNELTKMKKLFGSKCSLTLQFCCSAIWFWK